MKIFKIASEKFKCPIEYEFKEMIKIDIQDALYILEELIHFPELMQASGKPINNLQQIKENPILWLQKNFVSEKRLQQWINGRFIALKFWKKGLNKISVSHYQNHILVCGTKNINIGIDLENSTRILKESLKKRMFSTHERTLNIDPILLWTTKEAAFKASKNVLQVISEVSIVSSHLMEDKLPSSNLASFNYSKIYEGYVKWEVEDQEKASQFYAQIDSNWAISLVLNTQNS